MEGQYLAGRMLLAMPGMFDPRFERSVNVLCVHDEHGALGINVGEVREGVTFHAILDDLGLDTALAPDCAVLNGGPVEPGRGFVLHSLDWGGGDSIEVHAEDGPLCALSASMDILRAIAQGRGPSQWVMALGYAGWAPGQLEEEMRHHGWYAAQGSREVLFDTSAEARWAGAWKHEGIDPGLLANQTGNA
ncbi:YqgE/AlgH family protein [Novosphingobium sp. BW1]|uniref:YqgE/AlgH family protein n=1 Tax=Novosphingobium sp. BW1 TaxID=2592621 RepID=UPI0011DEF42E|nr:YqgE/AlgH family protein [Novosphingobium sp. BW1]TYC89438.1 YqgE/AlgH family protein [Novosphingobium sp. BW1]